MQNLKKTISPFFFITSLMVTPLFAQALDQNIFDQIKRQTGAKTEATQVRSPLDQLREREYLDQLNNQMLERRSNGLSIIERDYNSRNVDLGGAEEGVLQFGYGLFDRLPMPDDMVTGAISDNYILGVGDELVISFKGSKEEVLTSKVDREGRLIIPSLQPLTVAGLTFGQIKTALEKQVSESLIGTEIFVSVATLRQISVLVVGEVENPAIVRTTSLATPVEALLHVGGVKKTGSLRNIILQRGNEKIAIDLYSIVEGTNPEIINLKDGDRLIVPTIGATIAVGGNVIRAGIFELPPGESEISARDALKLVGGTIRPSGNDFTHVKYDENGRLLFDELAENGTLSKGEMVIVSMFDNSEEGRVTLVGHVKTPGVRSVKAYSTVKDLIGSVKNLTENPYTLFGVIVRTDEISNNRQFIAFNLHNVLYKDEVVNLKDEDKVLVFGRKDVEFLSSEEIRKVIYAGAYLENELLDDGESNRFYCRPIERLAKLVSGSQSDRFSTATRAIYVRDQELTGAVDERVSILDQLELDNLEDKRVEAISGLSDLSNAEILRNAKLEERKEKEEAGKYNPTCPEIYNDNENLLPFVLEYLISVEGAVRLPGVIPITENSAIDVILSILGGTSNDADLTKIELSSLTKEESDNSRVLNWSFIDASLTDLSTVMVSPGGGLRVSSVYTNFEDGAVLLSGEFFLPGVYTIRKGEKLSSLIERAGGLTTQAYPYGSIFTRNRVKEMQKNEMHQTAQRLQSAMVSASVKKNIDAAGVVAIQRMVNEMAEQDFLGRVVIESDPVVLALDPEKDIVLEAGDSLYVPKRPNFIVTVGDVLNPSALQFVPGKGVNSYLEEVGGFTRAADEDRVFVVYPNGVARPISLSSWGGDRNLSLPPGSAIVVPTDLSPYDSLTLVSEIGDIFRNLAVSAASIAILVRN